VDRVELFGERLHASLAAGAAAGAAAHADDLAAALTDVGLEVFSSRPVPPSLEDLFITMIRSADQREVH
jgi:hypothetical protein